MLSVVRFKQEKNTWTTTPEVKIDNVEEIFGDMPFAESSDPWMYNRTCRFCYVWVNREDAIWPSNFYKNDVDFSKPGLYYGKMLLRQKKEESRGKFYFYQELNKTDESLLSLPIYYGQKKVEEQGDRIV